MLKVEAPTVPNEELKAAIPWCIQDMIDFPVEQAVIDYYPLPNFDLPGRGRTIMVTVIQSEIIYDYTRYCEQAGLALKVIDIQELALRNQRNSTLIFGKSCS